MAAYRDLVYEVDIKGTDDYEERLHPIVTDIKNGRHITHIEVMGYSEDDHLPCFKVKITVDWMRVHYVAFNYMADGFMMVLFNATSGNNTKMVRAFNRLEQLIKQAKINR